MNLLATLTREVDQPAQGESWRARGEPRQGPGRSRPADAAGADLKRAGQMLLEGAREHGDGSARSLAGGLKCAVDDALGDVLLAVRRTRLTSAGCVEP